MITKYMIEIQMAGHQKNITFIKLVPIQIKAPVNVIITLYSNNHMNCHV